MAAPRLSGAPVVPNAGKVIGRLLRITPEPTGHGSVWEIAVEDSRDVDDLPNFTKSHVGGAISVYVHPQLKHDLSETDRLEARVAFRGDERGGRFVLVDDDLRKL